MVAVFVFLDFVRLGMLHEGDRQLSTEVGLVLESHIFWGFEKFFWIIEGTAVHTL